MAPFLDRNGINLRLDESLISSVFALKVTPKKDTILFLILFFKIKFTLLDNKSDLLLLDLITLLIIDRLVLNFWAVETIALVSLGKQDPPYEGPALKNLLPILLSSPIPIEISSTSIPVFSHKFAISFIKVIFVAKKAFDAYLINSAALLWVDINFAPFEINGEYKFFSILWDLLSF